MAITELIRSRQLPRPELRRALRLEAGLSLADLASRLDVHRSTISKWELGHREPRAANREAYASLLAELKKAVGDV